MRACARTSPIWRWCCCAATGIAARYVSGYLFAPAAGEETDSAEVDTHAWVEALIPAPDGGEPVVGLRPIRPTARWPARIT